MCASAYIHVLDRELDANALEAVFKLNPFEPRRPVLVDLLEEVQCFHVVVLHVLVHQSPRVRRVLL
jgi:hypothetical protein